MSGMDAVIYFGDLARFEQTLDKVGKLPQKVVTKAAGKGRTVVRKAIRAEAPVDTGALKRGIYSNGERSKVKGKKVYKIMFNPSMNEILQRPIKNPGVISDKQKSDHAYYPASMEYGFLTRDKGGGIRYVDGRHFMRKGAEQSKSAAASAVIRAATAELEKEWVK